MNINCNMFLLITLFVISQKTISYDKVFYISTDQSRFCLLIGLKAGIPLPPILFLKIVIKVNRFSIDKTQHEYKLIQTESCAPNFYISQIWQGAREIDIYFNTGINPLAMWLEHFRMSIIGSPQSESVEIIGEKDTYTLLVHFSPDSSMFYPSPRGFDVSHSLKPQWVQEKTCLFMINDKFPAVYNIVLNGLPEDIFYLFAYSSHAKFQVERDVNLFHLIPYTCDPLDKYFDYRFQSTNTRPGVQLIISFYDLLNSGITKIRMKMSHLGNDWIKSTVDLPRWDKYEMPVDSREYFPHRESIFIGAWETDFFVCDNNIEMCVHETQGELRVQYWEQPYIPYQLQEQPKLVLFRPLSQQEMQLLLNNCRKL